MKRKDIGLLKAVGAPLPMIRNQFLIHFGLVSGVATLFGIIMSLIASFSVTYYVIESEWVISWLTPFISFFLVLGLSLLVTYVGVNKSLKTKTTNLLGIE